MFINQYQDMSRNEEAIAAWWNATRQNATHSFAWNNIVVMLDNMSECTVTLNKTI